jgi:hypothetical protein
MKKKFYRATNLLLSSLITMLGFGACHTTKSVVKEDTVTVNADEEADRLKQIEEMEAQKAKYDSLMKAETRERERPTVVLYGVRPPAKTKMPESPKKESGEDK